MYVMCWCGCLIDCLPACLSVWVASRCCCVCRVRVRRRCSGSSWKSLPMRSVGSSSSLPQDEFGAPFSLCLSLSLSPPPPALRSRAPSAHDVTDLLTACVRGWCVRVCAQVACQPADFMERRRRRAMPDGGDVLPGAVPAALLLRRDYGAPSALRSGQLHVHRHGLSSCSLACWSSEECTELIAPVAATYVVIRIHSDLNPESQTDLRLRS
jgi:hypothetical protein